MEYLIINLIKFDIKIKYDYTKLLVSVGDFSNLITNVHCHADKLVHDLQRAIQKWIKRVKKRNMIIYKISFKWKSICSVILSIYHFLYFKRSIS